MKYKTFKDAREDGWSLVPPDEELGHLGTYYSYWKRGKEVLCEDDLIENWAMNDSHKKRMVRTYESIC